MFSKINFFFKSHDEIGYKLSKKEYFKNNFDVNYLYFNNDYFIIFKILNYLLERQLSVFCFVFKEKVYTTYAEE